MSLPARIEKVEEGQFISATHFNQVIDVVNALLRGEGRNGVKFLKAEAGFVWKGSGTGSTATGSSEGSSVSFRGHWNSITTYSEGDVVFVDGTDDQAALQANTYVSLQSGNINHTPPAITSAYEDSWWRVVAIGSFPTFVVANPSVAPVDERIVTLAPGAGQFYISGSGQQTAGTYDTTEIIGGNQTVGKSLTVSYGPVTINFPDGTQVLFDFSDVEGSSMAGRTFKLREVSVCDNGVERYMGILATEIYDT